MTSTRRGLLLGGLAGTAVVATRALGPGRESPVAGAPADPAFFGLHDGSGLSSSRLSPGALRLWDVGVTWEDLEPSPGRFDFSRLHALLSQFPRQGALQVTYVFGYTPLFHSSRGRPTHADPPRLDRLAAFATRLVSELESSYPGVVTCYQVWNEPSDSLFFTGTAADLVAMTRTVSRAVRAVAPRATVVAPSFPTRLASQRDWFRRYLAARADGVPPWAWFDRVGFSMYPPVGRGPEAMPGLLAGMQAIMRDAGVPAGRQVAHASEVNYDVGGSSPPTLLPDPLQVALTMRTYLVGAVAGFERVHWYRYDWGYVDGHPLGNTYWTDPDDPARVTPAGLAFDRVRSWLSGGRPAGEVGPSGLCRVSVGDDRTILWQPDGTTTVPVSAYGQVVTRSDGNVLVYQPGEAIPVDQRPVLVARA